MKQTLFILLAALTLLCSCNRNTYYSEIKQVPHEKWAVDKPLYYKMTIEDSMQYFNMYIQLRNTTDFATQNFYVFMKT